MRIIPKQERIREALKRHPDWSDRRIARALHMRIFDITECKAIREKESGRNVSNKAISSAIISMGQGSGASLSVKEFMKRLDYDQMLRDALAEHCRDKFIIESQIRTMSGIPPALWRAVADRKEFAHNHIADSGKIWWSVTENVQKVLDKKTYWGIAR